MVKGKSELVMEYGK